MKMIVGLGNPGPKYQMTRHNIGFLVIDAFLEFNHQPQNYKKEKKAEIQWVQIGSEKVLLVKPMTYMNLSGESVSELANYYKITPEDILVIQDDIDQGFSAIRFQTSRGHGGHNGIRDIHLRLATKDYDRLKVGVGRPNHPKMDVADYVLQNFAKIEEAELADLLYDCCKSLETYIQEGFEIAATRFNRKVSV